MKELTTEQKAQRYDEALNEAKEWYNNPNSDKIGKSYLWAVFPELKESEDERIKREIIGFIRNAYWTSNRKRFNELVAWLEKQGEKKDYYTKQELIDMGFSFTLNGDIVTPDEMMEDMKKYLSWKEKQSDNYLEKQGKKKSVDDLTQQEAMDVAVAKCFEQSEQKPTDKVEPKFHEGEWITNGDYTWKITEVKPLDYILQSQDGNIVDDTISHVDEQFHSFTIKDAKDGDVLFYKGEINHSNGIKFERICLFNNLDTAFFTLTKTSTYEEYAVDVNINYPENTIPATKEQKEILFMTMKEAGYEWDTEKKELKKIESYNLRSIIKGEPSPAIKEVVDSLSAWSEEDENNYKQAIYVCHQHGYNGVENWLKSLKDRHTWKPSEEQMEALANALSLAKNCGEESTFDLRTLYEQLKKLK